MVHRDLKPGNMVFTADGTVQVLDFGLAKAMSDERPRAAGARSRTGGCMGTPAYMSPEQAKGAKVDKRADIWAFGCVLFEMLTGRPAFAGETVRRDAGGGAARTAGLGDASCGYAPGCAAGPDPCLQKDPKQRVRDIGDVKMALTGVFTSDAVARSQRWPRRSRVPLASCRTGPRCADRSEFS